MKAGLSVISSAIKESWIYRFGIIVTSLYAPIYITIMYFFWRAVFNASSSGTLNGMNWSQTIIYLSISAIISGNLYSGIDYKISNIVRSGNLVVNLARPMDFQLYFFLRAIGEISVNFLLMLLPSTLFIVFVLRLDFIFGTGAVFFIPSVLLSIFIAYLMDYIVGLFSFYTEAIYGIANAKAILLMFFSGRTIPLALFPAALKSIAMLLPFQAVINTPILLLTDTSLDLSKAVSMLAIQIFWALALLIVSRLFFNIALRKVTVNGG